jgi:NADPH2:quinone reductase
VHVPGAVDLESAAAAMLQGMTAHYLTNSTWPLKAGETALVHAAAGGMGLLLSQLARAKGARVIGTTSSEDKAKLAREAGADVVINYAEVEDLAAKVRELTDGRGVDVVYDGVGKSTFEASLNSLRKRGLLALYGAASGPVPPFDPQELNRRGSLFLTRPTLADHIVTRDELEWRANDILAAVADGNLKINIGERYPLERAADAHTALAGRATTGKLLVIP